MNIHPNTIPATLPPTYMSYDDKTRANKAAHLVHRYYPPEVAIVCAQEINSWTDVGIRLDPKGIIAALIDHIHQLAQETA